jgi:hypothetical protein
VNERGGSTYCVVKEPIMKGPSGGQFGEKPASCVHTWYVVAAARGGTEYAAPAGCCADAFGDGSGLGTGTAVVVTTDGPLGGINVTVFAPRNKTMVFTSSGIPVDPGAG